MPLIIETTDPHGLLQEIKDKIDAGDIKTWSYQGDQFDYLAAQYANEQGGTFTGESYGRSEIYRRAVAAQDFFPHTLSDPEAGRMTSE